MTQNYQRKHVQNLRRKSTAVPIFICEENEDEITTSTNRRLSVCPNTQRRLSTVSQLYLPNGNEYEAQDHVPPAGQEYQQTLVINADEANLANDLSQRRQSIFSKDLYDTTIDENVLDQDEPLDRKKRVLFFVEPIITGLLLFPILVLFWETGWNLALIVLNRLNGYNSTVHLDEMNQDEETRKFPFSWHSLLVPYLIVQLLLSLLYIFQEVIYRFLQNRNSIIRQILLNVHILLLATIYIVQWEMLWSIWDEFTPSEWFFQFTLSFAALFALIVFIGHLSDLVCSPFLFSYDSPEYCIHFGCPLLTRQMKQWKINLLNFFLYEVVVSNLTIMTWRGFYHYLDEYFYPDNVSMSAGLCLLIGYLLYFPLMYFQTYLEELNLKYDFWTFISINFPQFYRNIRHLLAFLSCLFVWRGYWVLYDEHIYIFEEYYKTYLLFYLVSFICLSLLHTSSSINGPLSNIEDDNNFFPLYPHCYVSIIQRKFSQWGYFQDKPKEDLTKV